MFKTKFFFLLLLFFPFIWREFLKAFKSASISCEISSLPPRFFLFVFSFFIDAVACRSFGWQFQIEIPFVVCLCLQSLHCCSTNEFDLCSISFLFEANLISNNNCRTDQKTSFNCHCSFDCYSAFGSSIHLLAL